MKSWYTMSAVFSCSLHSFLSLSEVFGGLFFYAKKLKKTFDFPYYGIIIISVKREENKT